MPQPYRLTKLKQKPLGGENFDVTGESEGSHDDQDFNETFCPASDNRASNTSSFEKDQIAEDHVQEKAVSRIAPNNQNLGTATNKIEKIKSSEMSQQPAVRERNIDLQSKLRDLMKCGSSTNTTNPFASRKLEVPSSTLPQPLQLQLQQQPGTVQDAVHSASIVTPSTRSPYVTAAAAPPQGLQQPVTVITAPASVPRGGVTSERESSVSVLRDFTGVAPMNYTGYPANSGYELGSPEVTKSTSSILQVSSADASASLRVVGSNLPLPIPLPSYHTLSLPMHEVSGLQGPRSSNLTGSIADPLLMPYTAHTTRTTTHTLGVPFQGHDTTSSSVVNNTYLRDPVRSRTQSPVQSPIRSPVRSPVRSPARTAFMGLLESENPIANLFDPKSFSLNPDGDDSNKREIFGSGSGLLGPSLLQQNNPSAIPEAFQHDTSQTIGGGGVGGGGLSHGQGPCEGSMQEGLNLTDRQDGPGPPRMHPMSLFQGPIPMLHGHGHGHGGYYPPHLPLPPQMPHLHMQMPPHLQPYPHIPFRGPPGPAQMMYPPFPRLSYPLGHGPRHPMGIGLPPGMYPMVYDPSMYNLPRGPPEMRRIDGDFGGQGILSGPGPGPPIGSTPLQDLRYTNRMDSPFPTEKDHGYPPHVPLSNEPGYAGSSGPRQGQGQMQPMTSTSLFGSAFNGGDERREVHEREGQTVDRNMMGFFSEESDKQFGHDKVMADSRPAFLRTTDSSSDPIAGPLDLLYGHTDHTPGTLSRSSTVEPVSIYTVDKDTITMSPQRDESRAPRAAFMSYLSGERQAPSTDYGIDLNDSLRALDVNDPPMPMPLPLALPLPLPHALPLPIPLSIPLSLPESAGPGDNELALKLKLQEITRNSSMLLLEQLKAQDVEIKLKRQQDKEALEKQQQNPISQVQVQAQEQADKQVQEQALLVQLQQQNLRLQQQQQQQQQQQHQQQQQQQMFQTHAGQVQMQSPPQPLPVPVPMRTDPLKGQALLSLLRSSAPSPLIQQSPFQLGPRPVGTDPIQGPAHGLGLPPGLTPPPGMVPKGMTPIPIMTTKSMSPPPGMVPRGMTPIPMMTLIRSTQGENTEREGILRSIQSLSPPLPILPTTDVLGATVQKKTFGTYRYTRGQEGILLLGLNNGKSAISLNNVSRHIVAGSSKDDAVFDTEGAVVRPGGAMVVIWQVPEAMYMDKDNINLSIGLTRYGSLSNFPCVVAKSIGPLSNTTIRSRDIYGNAVVRGRIPFHAPKAAGPFVYRLFDQSSKEKMLITLGTSPLFAVRIFDFEVTSNLRFCFDAFEDKCHMKGVTQLQSIIIGMCNSGKATRKDDPRGLLQSCVKSVLEMALQGVAVLDGAKEQDAERKERHDSAKASSSASSSTLVSPATATATTPPTAAADTSTDGDESKKLFKTKNEEILLRQTSRLQMEIYDTIVSLRLNDIAWNNLNDIQRREVMIAESLFCKIMNRFFSSSSNMAKGRIQELGFLPSPPSTSTHYPTLSVPLCARFEAQIMTVLPSLMPSKDFDAKREVIRASLQVTVRATGVVPPGTQVALFGSSMNNFGKDDADMDMTLILPDGGSIPPEDKSKAVISLGAAFEKLPSMMDIKLRPTARIPIVQFIDQASGVRCDMSFGNSLAITNTLLLRTYSEIDPRIRPLAYIVKHWVQCRHINSPADGTLSSYGYVICLLYFLQNRPIPLIPNLQKIPSNWTGQSPSNNQLQSDRESDEHRFDLSHHDNTTYFYKPENNPIKISLLSKFASRNKESIGELLAAFFNFFAWQFDYNSDVVSIQSGKEKGVSKIQKAESDGWPQHEQRLSIEDPFEAWYDVAHVIKSFQMTFIRKEFLRAHTIVTRCLSQTSLQSTSTSTQNPLDCLPGIHAVQPEHLLTALCEATDPPSFSSSAKAERALRKNTIEAMGDTDDVDL